MREERGGLEGRERERDGLEGERWTRGKSEGERWTGRGEVDWEGRERIGV